MRHLRSDHVKRINFFSHFYDVRYKAHELSKTLQKDIIDKWVLMKKYYSWEILHLILLTYHKKFHRIRLRITEIETRNSFYLINVSAPLIIMTKINTFEIKFEKIINSVKRESCECQLMLLHTYVYATHYTF